MKFTMKKFTHAYVGNMPITFLEDTEVDVQADSIDHIASMLASSGGQRAFGEHLESLKHKKTITRNIDGVPHAVDVEVSYGAGGAPVETDLAEPRKIDTKIRPSGGIGTETIPGASGSGASFSGESGTPTTPAAVASEDGQDLETERLRSVPRVEFVVPPKRFPDEVQTATDPPRETLVGDSPERETPYVGEYTQTGAFSRQPSADRGTGQFGDDRIPIIERAATEGRPMPTPDTPGTRDRVFPAPSETARSLPDQTAVALNVAQTGSSQIGEVEAPGPDATVVDDGTGDDLPADFPHLKELEDNGITKYSQLEGKTIDELSGPDFKGIGLVKAQDIVDELKKRKK